MEPVNAVVRSQCTLGSGEAAAAWTTCVSWGAAAGCEGSTPLAGRLSRLAAEQLREVLRMFESERISDRTLPSLASARASSLTPMENLGVTHLVGRCSYRRRVWCGGGSRGSHSAAPLGSRQALCASRRSRTAREQLASAAWPCHRYLSVAGLRRWGGDGQRVSLSRARGGPALKGVLWLRSGSLAQAACCRRSPSRRHTPSKIRHSRRHLPPNSQHPMSSLISTLARWMRLLRRVWRQPRPRTQGRPQRQGPVQRRARACPLRAVPARRLLAEREGRRRQPVHHPTVPMIAEFVQSATRSWAPAPHRAGRMIPTAAAATSPARSLGNACRSTKR